MNLHRWDRIVIAVDDKFYEAIVRKVGQEIRCEYKVDTSGGRAFSNFGPVFYDKHTYTVRRRDEGLTWARAGDQSAVEALKAARALR